MTSEERSYLTFVTKNIAICYVCRYPECGFFGMNNVETWVKNASSYHFRCPACGLQYQPWVEKFGKKKTIEALPFNKVLVFTNVHENNKQTIVPCWWPETCDDEWLGAQAEIHARNIQTPEDLDNFLNKNVVDLSEVMERAGRPWKGFNLMRLTDEARVQLDSASGYGGSYGKQLENGFYGLMCTQEEKKAPVFKDWGTLIALIGNLVAVGKTLTALKP